MPLGLSSCNWIPDAGLRCSGGMKEDEGMRSWVVEVDRNDGVGASQEACLPPAETGLIPTKLVSLECMVVGGRDYLFGRGGEYLLMMIGDGRLCRRGVDLDLLSGRVVLEVRVDAK